VLRRSPASLWHQGEQIVLSDEIPSDDELPA
jgi:hypothetical protein